MAFQHNVYDGFEIFSKPRLYALYTSGTPNSNYPGTFGKTIEPIVFETQDPLYGGRGDKLIIDGEPWTLLRVDHATMNVTHGDAYLDPMARNTDIWMYVVTVSDGTAERYFGIPLDNSQNPLKDLAGNTLTGTHFYIWVYYDAGYIDLRQGARDDDVKMGAVCFASGSMIETASGPRPVQSLRVGDLVVTRDNGVQPVRWIGGRLLRTTDLEAAPNLLPVRIAAGALGPGCPAQDLTVSPQHRVLLRSPIAARMAGSAEVLVAAVQLVGMPGITRCSATGGVSYWHLMFDRHEIVFANGAESESLYLGKMALQALSPSARAELRAIFPDLMREAEGDPRPLARPVMRGAALKKMLERQVRHSKPLVAAG